MFKLLKVALVCLALIIAGAQLGRNCLAQTNGTILDLKSFCELQNEAVGRPVDFSATVTFVEPLWNFVFVQDQGVAVFVNGTEGVGLELGDRVRIKGVGTRGDLRATVSASEVTRIASGKPPKPIKFSVSDHKIGDFDAQYVSVEAVVVHAVSGMNHTVYLCEENGIEYHVSMVGDATVEEMWKLIGARIKFVGALGVTLKDGTESDDVSAAPREIEMVRVHCMSQQLEVITEGRKDECPTSFDPASDPNVFLLDGQVTMKTKDFFVLADFQVARQIKFLNSYGFGMSHIVRVAGNCSRKENGELNFDALVLQSFFSNRLPTPFAFQDLPKEERLWEYVKVKGRPENIRKVGNELFLEIHKDGQTANVELLNVNTLGRSLTYPTLQVLRNCSLIEVTGAVSECDSKGDCTVLVPNQMHLQIIDSFVPFWKYIAWGLLPITALFSVGFLYVKSQRNRVAAKAESIRAMHTSLISTYRAINDGLLAIDTNKEVLTTNEKLCEIFGRDFNAGESFNNELCLEFLSRIKNRAIVENFLFQKPLDDSNESHIVVEIVEPESATFELSDSLILDDEDNTIGRLLIFRDQTKERQLQAELIHLNKIEAVGQLAGGIAHDFNNILTTIMANLSLLNLESNFSSRAINQIEDAEMAAGRGRDLIRRLLTYTGKTELNPQLHSINKIVQELHQFARATFDARYVFKFEFDESDPVVEVDAGVIEQIVLNLYLNARDAMPSGGSITTKTFLSTDSEQTTVSICIVDEGDPIPVDIQEQIFEPFFTTKAGEAGTGLGLSTSKRLISAQNGRLQYLPSSSSGNSFLITLPFVQITGETKLSNSDSHKKSKPIGSVENKTVLVVDDEDSIRKICELILAKYGYEVLTAAHGDAALEILNTQHERVDMVLLDLTMPGISGLDVIEVALERYPKVPIVLCSGNLSGVPAVVSGQILTLAKPFSVDQLLAVIDKAIQTTKVLD